MNISNNPIKAKTFLPEIDWNKEKKHRFNFMMTDLEIAYEIDLDGITLYAERDYLLFEHHKDSTVTFADVAEWGLDCVSGIKFDNMGLFYDFWRYVCRIMELNFHFACGGESMPDTKRMFDQQYPRNMKDVTIVKMGEHWFSIVDVKNRLANYPNLFFN